MEFNLSPGVLKTLQLTIDALPDGVMILNTEGIILLTNNVQDAFLQSTKENIIGKSIDYLAQKDLYSNPIMDLVMKRKKSVTFMTQTPIQTCLMVTGTPVINQNGQVVFFVIYSKDLTKLNDLQNHIKSTEQLTPHSSTELIGPRTQQNKYVNMVANSKEIRKVLELTKRVAKVDSTVLILGESGVGKELIARTIHEQSPRKLGPFIKINCSAIPESLIESELFGYEPGTFTGGKKEGKPGLFELANNGDLLLDEIGELPISLQPKLLRVLQEQEVIRLGGAKARKINVRIIAATNHDLREQVRQKLFREDLFFRLNVIPIVVPPLRERKDDIIPLIYHFRDYYCEKYNLKKDFSGKVLNILLNYEWLGNVRELQNVVERLLIISNDDLIQPHDIPPDLLAGTTTTKHISVNKIIPMKEAVLELETELIGAAMNRFGSTLKVAEALGVHQTTVIRKLHKLGIYSKQSRYQ